MLIHYCQEITSIPAAFTEGSESRACLSSWSCVEKAPWPLLGWESRCECTNCGQVSVGEPSGGLTGVTKIPFVIEG